MNLCTQDAEGGQALFIDGGVYTRNRAFRLFLSSKAGKDAVLQPTGEQSPPAHSRVQMRPQCSGNACVQVLQEPCLMFLAKASMLQSAPRW